MEKERHELRTESDSAGDGGDRNTPRLFHYSEGSSHKFWSIAVEEAVQTVRWGRIGSTGQTQRKQFSSEAEAREISQRLIQAKQRKGYVEVSPEAAQSVPVKKPPRASRRACQQLLLPF